MLSLHLMENCLLRLFVGYNRVVIGHAYEQAMCPLGGHEQLLSTHLAWVDVFVNHIHRNEDDNPH